MKAILLFWMICLGLHIAPASAQSEADWNVILREAMLQEIVDTAALNNDPGTARQGYDKCLDISKRLAARTDVLALQRLFLEAMISRCISHAMFNGQFSDDTGDACAHEYGGATKLVQALAEARNRPELGEALYTFTDALYQAIGAGATMDCEQDFLALKPPAP